MNIEKIKDKIKPRTEPHVILAPFEESSAQLSYRIDGEGKSNFFRKLENLCSVIYEYEDFQKHKFYKGELSPSKTKKNKKQNKDLFLNSPVLDMINTRSDSGSSVSRSADG